MSLSSKKSSSPSRFFQNENEPLFQAPWEARVFAIVNQLTTVNQCNWSEWTTQFATEISAAEAEATDTSSYYERWARACEKLLIAKEILDEQAIDQRIKELIIEQEHQHGDIAFPNLMRCNNRNV